MGQPSLLSLQPNPHLTFTPLHSSLAFPRPHFSVLAATRSGRPASARQLNPNSLAAKISGVQQPPEGAQVVQRDRQAFQQDYRGSADISGGWACG